MNGLLFVAVLFGLQDDQPPRDPSVLPHANASVPLPPSSSLLESQLGDRQYLTYQQWVDLLRQEVIAAQAAPRLTVLLGDSISLWFPPHLLPGRRTWLNQAISGERSDGLYQRLPDLDDATIETIFLMVGINDLLAGVPEDQLVQNLEDTVAYLRRQHPNADIVVQSILPHGAEQATWEGRDRLLALPNGRIQSVNTALAKIAAEAGADYLDLYPLFANGEGALRADLSTDGLHLNERGYLVWRTAIALFRP
ncbi:MAG: lysophospholipase [Leptolyngbya sp. RL_3_1]|nr:lysophospholipase [Leptolyngbya sp. RL_3_1]